jgi:hypothetical protein
MKKYPASSSSSKLVVEETQDKIFVGRVRSGNLEGFADVKLENGDKYTGEYSNEKANGFGRLGTPKYIYVGNFENNRQKGFGIIKSSDSEYVGMVESGVKHGPGYERIGGLNPCTMRGMFIDGTLEGFSTVHQLTTGIKASGYFTNMLLDGYGRLEEPGSSYLGEFKEHRKSGVGTFKVVDGECFSGEWVDDLKDGFGTELRGDTLYKGDFVKGLKTGLCEMENKKQGFRYIGSMLGGQMHKFGRYETLETAYIGGYQNNQRWGIGYQKVEVLGSYYGYWKNDLREGLGIEKSNDYEYYGRWFNDVPEGEGILTKKNGTVIAGIFKEGKMVETLDPGYIRKFEVEFGNLDFDSFWGMAKDNLNKLEEYLKEGVYRVDMARAELGRVYEEENGQLERNMQILEGNREVLEKEYTRLLNDFERECRERDIGLPAATEEDERGYETARFNKPQSEVEMAEEPISKASKKPIARLDPKQLGQGMSDSEDSADKTVVKEPSIQSGKKTRIDPKSSTPGKNAKKADRHAPTMEAIKEKRSTKDKNERVKKIPVKIKSPRRSRENSKEGSKERSESSSSAQSKDKETKKRPKKTAVKAKIADKKDSRKGKVYTNALPEDAMNQRKQLAKKEEELNQERIKIEQMKKELEIEKARLSQSSEQLVLMNTEKIEGKTGQAKVGNELKAGTG